MTDDRDPMLQALFADAREELADDGFTARLMSRVDRLARLARLRRIGIAVLVIICAWFAAAPVQMAAWAVIRGLSYPLIPLDGGWIAILIAPANTYAGLLVLFLLSLRTAYRAVFVS